MAHLLHSRDARSIDDKEADLMIAPVSPISKIALKPQLNQNDGYSQNRKAKTLFKSILGKEISALVPKFSVKI